ncbi:unnamed protein product [Lasius platythorax]|uniref:Uncharacterized protein n=1 Tax=Lasius platythorax TaxID=488582 RepID=A0AAV2NXJ8_9HYME
MSRILIQIPQTKKMKRTQMGIFFWKQMKMRKKLKSLYRKDEAIVQVSSKCNEKKLRLGDPKENGSRLSDQDT